jgi:hypothetical protein
MHPSTVIALVALAAIQAALVALPCHTALERLGPLRSPAWALVAPGALIFGTFGVLALPGLATGLGVLAAVATPVLAAIAVVAVVRGRRRALLLVPLALGVVAVAGHGLPGEVAASLLTALGCMTLGAALVRLTPALWLYVGVFAMAVVDVLLLALHIGQPAAALLQHALDSSILPAFHHAAVGPVTTDYPDLVLAAVVGGIVAGRPIQQRAALLVGALAATYGGLLAFTHVLPATVPIVLTLVLIEGSELAPRLRRGMPVPAPAGA